MVIPKRPCADRDALCHLRRGELKKKMEHAMAHPEDINKVAEVQKQVRRSRVRPSLTLAGLRL